MTALMSLPDYLLLPGLLAWLAWTFILLRPARPWLMTEHLEPASTTDEHGLHDIDVLIPARNEAGILPKVLSATLAQGSAIRISVVDDESTDNTAVQTAELAASEPRARLIQGKSKPPGWTGKLWAQEQGREQMQRPFVLLLDADIVLAPGMIAALRARLLDRNLDFVSVLANPGLKSLLERLLLTPYVFFFKLLYPFRLANDPAAKLAAAAGGCLLVRRHLLDDLDVFQTIRGELIDDCAFARRIKSQGGKTWTGVSQGAISIRDNGGFRGIRQLISRHAYTQLNYSPFLLMAVTLIMLIMFLTPLLAGLLAVLPATLVPAAFPAAVTSVGWGLGSFLVMLICYLPTLRYYHLSPLWGLLLPVSGLAYLAMTWESAWRYHGSGHKAVWRERTYPNSHKHE
ncbi:MAG: glycosyltransferase [Pseudomonadales bacterium]|nr:glycosyltransferase [Pseudomonadales bacterium]